MALDQFWEAFRAEAPKHTWVLFPVTIFPHPGSTLRLRTLAPGGTGRLCPLMAISHAEQLTTEGLLALGITAQDALQIMDASDGVPGHDATVRAALLAITGVKEV